MKNLSPHLQRRKRFERYEYIVADRDRKIAVLLNTIAAKEHGGFGFRLILRADFENIRATGLLTSKKAVPCGTAQYRSNFI